MPLYADTLRLRRCVRCGHVFWVVGCVCVVCDFRASVVSCTYVETYEGAFMNMPGETNTTVTLLDNIVHGFVWCTHKVADPHVHAPLPWALAPDARIASQAQYTAPLPSPCRRQLESRGLWLEACALRSVAVLFLVLVFENPLRRSNVLVFGRAWELMGDPCFGVLSRWIVGTQRPDKLHMRRNNFNHSFPEQWQMLEQVQGQSAQHPSIYSTAQRPCPSSVLLRACKFEGCVRRRIHAHQKGTTDTKANTGT